MRLAVTNHRFASQRVRFVENVNDEHSVNQLTGGVETVGLIAGFDQIFRPNTISRFSYFYNFHPSLLPYYRGPVPSHWCIANGEEFTGVTLHTVTGQIDAGAIIAQKVVKICTSDEHELDLAVAQSGAEILIELLDGLCKGVPLPHSQVLADRYYKVLVDYRSFPRPAAQ
jgi:methionyl-tRNA formyltransferase